MTHDVPPDGLYIRWGRFEAAIQGRLGLVAAAAVAMLLILSWWFPAG